MKKKNNNNNKIGCHGSVQKQFFRLDCSVPDTSNFYINISLILPLPIHSTSPFSSVSVACFSIASRFLKSALAGVVLGGAGARAAGRGLFPLRRVLRHGHHRHLRSRQKCREEGQSPSLVLGRHRNHTIQMGDVF